MPGDQASVHLAAGLLLEGAGAVDFPVDLAGERGVMSVEQGARLALEPIGLGHGAEGHRASVPQLAELGRGAGDGPELRERRLFLVAIGGDEPVDGPQDRLGRGALVGALAAS